MATTSLVPAARTALLSALTASLAGGGVQCSASHPGDAIERESVYLGDCRFSYDLATIRSGRRSRDQEFVLDVWLVTTTDGPDAQAATTRAWQLFAYLEDIVANKPTLGLAQPFWAVVTDGDEVLGWDEDRRGAFSRIRAGVTCTGRVT